MVGFYPTTVEPMKSLVQRLRDAEQEPGILSVSLAHGFPWGDQAEAGTRMLVIARWRPGRWPAPPPNGSAAKSMRCATNLLPKMPSIAEAIERARASDGLVVMADTADNAGGGAPGDTTHLSAGLVEFWARDRAPSPPSTTRARSASARKPAPARLDFADRRQARLSSGDPLMSMSKSWRSSPITASLCSAAPLRSALRPGSGSVMSTSCSHPIRTQIFARDGFTGLGISLDDKKVVAVKSSEHFRADFGALADHVIPVATPGALQLNFATMPYRHKQDMHFHPRVADPLALGG